MLSGVVELDSTSLPPSKIFIVPTRPTFLLFELNISLKKVVILVLPLVPVTPITPNSLMDCYKNYQQHLP